MKNIQLGGSYFGSFNAFHEQFVGESFSTLYRIAVLGRFWRWFFKLRIESIVLGVSGVEPLGFLSKILENCARIRWKISFKLLIQPKKFSRRSWHSSSLFTYLSYISAVFQEEYFPSAMIIQGRLLTKMQ